MIQANSIAGVITELDKIIDWSKQHNSRIGYFTTLYRRMTLAMQQGILNNSFEDAKRMEQLDCVFANRYLQAWDAYINKQPCTSAWCAAFNACNSDKLIVLQHLILGINTHINLDLAIAAAETCPGDKIFALQKDFDKINDVISSLMQVVQDTLCKVWFPLKALAQIANHHQEPVLNFSIDAARKASWVNAVALAQMNSEVKNNYINTINATVVKVANRVINPDFGISFLLQPVHAMESKNVSDIIEMLKT